VEPTSSVEAMAIIASGARRIVIREKLRQGTLPRHRPIEAYEVPASGTTCVICTHRMEPPDSQYECMTQNGNVLHFCRTCYFCWLYEVCVRAA
jgi:hypothetical protein